MANATMYEFAKAACMCSNVGVRESGMVIGEGGERGWELEGGEATVTGSTQAAR